MKSGVGQEFKLRSGPDPLLVVSDISPTVNVTISTCWCVYIAFRGGEAEIEPAVLKINRLQWVIAKHLNLPLVDPKGSFYGFTLVLRWLWVTFRGVLIVLTTVAVRLASPAQLPREK